MLKVDLPPEYNNWAEVLNEKCRANQEIGQLNIKLTAAKERERVLVEGLQFIANQEKPGNWAVAIAKNTLAALAAKEE